MAIIRMFGSKENDHVCTAGIVCGS
jgi:hypothetical protein